MKFDYRNEISSQNGQVDNGKFKVEKYLKINFSNVEILRYDNSWELEI